MRKLFAVAAMVTTATLVVPTGARAQGSLVNDPAIEDCFKNKINDYRVGLGLVPLERHSELVAKARDWSHTMAEAGEIWHSHLPDGITAQWKRLGENVGMGGSCEALHEAFLDSPSHKENIQDPGFRKVGLGVTVDADGTIFVSEVFMELASQPAPAASSPASGTPNSSAGAQPAQPISSVKPGPEGGERPRSVSDGQKAVGAEVAPSPRLVSVLNDLRSLDRA